MMNDERPGTFISVFSDDPKASDCKIEHPTYYDTVADVLERSKELDIMYGVDNWSVYRTVRLSLLTTAERKIFDSAREEILELLENDKSGENI